MEKCAYCGSDKNVDLALRLGWNEGVEALLCGECAVNLGFQQLPYPRGEGVIAGKPLADGDNLEEIRFRVSAGALGGKSYQLPERN